MSRSLTTTSPNSSSAIIEVPSSSGFSAGDLVYYNGSTGDYGPIPASAVSSASWGGSSTNTAFSLGQGLFGGQALNSNPLGTRSGAMMGKYAAALIAAYPTATGTSGTNTITVSSATGIALGQTLTGLGIASTATVTNIVGTTITLSANNTATVSGNITFYTGNIVQAYMDPNNSYTFYFQIVTFAQASVVAPTQITSSYTNNTGGLGGVIALTGGGFVVYWLPSTGTLYPVYAIYNNSGTVVTAATQDSGTGTGGLGSYLAIYGTALQNGGFALAYSAGSQTSMFLRSYGATGTATYAWITTTGFNALANGFGIASRSDNSVCIAGPSATSNTWRYAIYDSSGTAIVASTTFTSTTGSSSPGAISVCCMLNDTFVLSYLSGGNLTFFGVRLLPTGNTLGSEIATNALPATNTALISTTIVATPISNNGASGFIVFVLGGSTYSVLYTIYNASGVSLSGTSGSSALVKQINTTNLVNINNAGPSAIEVPGAGIINVYSPGEGANTYPSYQGLVQISTTTYNPVNVYNTQQNVGSTTATPTAYGPSGSYPGGASFYTATNSYGIASTSTFGNVLRGPTTISSNASLGALSCTTFPNGNFAVLYIGASSNVFINLYSPTATLLTTFSTGLSISSAAYNYTRARICSLTSGKMALVYGQQGGTTWNILLYSISGTTFTQIGTTTTVVSATNNYQYNFNLAPITNDRFVICWSYSSADHRWAVYDNTNTQVATAQWCTVNTTGYHTVVGNPAGGFALSGYVNASNQQYASYTNTSGNTFTQVGTTITYNPGTGVMGQIGNGTAVCANGKMYFPFGYSQTTFYPTTYSVANQTPNLSQPVFNTSSGVMPNGIVTLGVTGQNEVFSVGPWSGNSYLSTKDGFGNQADYSTLTTIANTYNNGIYVCTCPSYGPYANIVYCDANGYPTLATISPSKWSMEYIAVTSTTPSVAIPIYPLATTTTSPAITKTVFVGVAVSNAPAGGSGQVQISGSAQLNTNYATTLATSFDFTGQAVPGVKGISNGRTVIITGNT